MTPFTLKKHPLAILAILATPSLSYSDDSTTQLKAVPVTATTVAAQTETTPVNELLQNGNSETGTALRKISGVDASRMGGHGVDLVIRGQQASQLNILLDGAKIEGGCPNRMDPPTAYVEMSSFDKVTVIKGVNSVTYGAGGSGGTVLFERNAPIFEDGKPYQGEINLGTTSNGLTQDTNATVAAGGDKGYIVLQGSKKSADNYKDGNGDEVRSSYESQQGHVDLGWTPNENNELRFSYENTLVEDALFQDAKMDAPTSDGTTTRLRYKGSKISESVQNIDIDVYRSTVDHVMNNYELRTLPVGGKRMETVSDVETKGAKVKLTSMIGHTQLDYGIQLESVEKMATLTNLDTGNSLFYMWPNTLQETKSVFAESTSFFKDQQKVILGLRYDAVTTEAKDANSPTDESKIATNVYTDAYTDYSGKTKTDDANINALLRYERRYDNNINVFSGVSRTHRYADATELYINKQGMDGQWIGNPDLDPEQHNQFDIGMSQTTAKTNWSVSAYYDVVNNYILRDLAKNQTDSLKISGKNIVYLNKDATIYGLDLAGQWKTSKHVKVGSSLSLTKGTNETDHRNLSNIAPLSGSAFSEYSANNWKAGTRFNFATAQTEVNAEYGELETAAWSTLDVYGNYKINKSIKLSAGVDNLFDHAYVNYLNRYDPTTGDSYKTYEPGRIAWVKLNAKF
jgi:iron complex outermembrane receptor protein